jgi:hypothetical protein
MLKAITMKFPGTFYFYLAIQGNHRPDRVTGDSTIKDNCDNPPAACVWGRIYVEFMMPVYGGLRNNINSLQVPPYVGLARKVFYSAAAYSQLVTNTPPDVISNELRQSKRRL